MKIVICEGEKCYEDFQYCQECKSNDYLFTKENNETSCVQNCPYGTYSSTAGSVKVCKACISNCKYQSLLTYFVQKDLFIFPISLNFENFPEFQLLLNLICIGLNCNLNSTKCEQCSLGFYIQTNGTCETSCADGSYIDGSVCKECTVNDCKDCVYLAPIRGETCEICQDGFVRNTEKNSCIKSGGCLDPTVKGQAKVTKRRGSEDYQVCESCQVDYCKFQKIYIFNL